MYHNNDNNEHKQDRSPGDKKDKLAKEKMSVNYDTNVNLCTLKRT